MRETTGHNFCFVVSISFRAARVSGRFERKAHWVPATASCNGGRGRGATGDLAGDLLLVVFLIGKDELLL